MSPAYVHLFRSEKDRIKRSVHEGWIGTENLDGTSFWYLAFTVKNVTSYWLCFSELSTESANSTTEAPTRSYLSGDSCVVIAADREAFQSAEGNEVTGGERIRQTYRPRVPGAGKLRTPPVYCPSL